MGNDKATADKKLPFGATRRTLEPARLLEMIGPSWASAVDNVRISPRYDLLRQFLSGAQQAPGVTFPTIPNTVVIVKDNGPDIPPHLLCGLEVIVVSLDVDKARVPVLFVSHEHEAEALRWINQHALDRRTVDDLDEIYVQASYDTLT